MSNKECAIMIRMFLAIALGFMLDLCAEKCLPACLRALVSLSPLSPRFCIPSVIHPLSAPHHTVIWTHHAVVLSFNTHSSRNQMAEHEEPHQHAAKIARSDDRPLKIDMHVHMLPENWPDLKEVREENGVEHRENVVGIQLVEEDRFFGYCVVWLLE
jgi:hypothetical protein